MSAEREQKLEAALHKVEDLALKLREERDKAFNAGLEAAAQKIEGGSAYSGYAEIGRIHAKWIRDMAKPAGLQEENK
jgi:hypothetical protein